MKQYSVEDWGEIFEPDGSLIDVIVFDTTWEDCQRLFDFVSSKYELYYYEDESVLPFPGLEAAFQRMNEHSTFLSIDVGGYKGNWHFWTTDWIEIDFLPNDVNSRERVDAMFSFISEIAKLLNKPTFLTPEFVSADDEKRRMIAICRADPPDGRLTFGQGWN